MGKRAAAIAMLGCLSAAGAWWLLHSNGQTLRPQRPEVSAEAAEPLELGASSLPVPVRIDLATLLQEVETHVPGSWGDLSRPVAMGDSGQTNAALELSRSRFQASLQGSTARLVTTVSYRVRGTYHLPLLPDVNYACATGDGAEWPRMDVELEAPITLTADWRLDTRTSVAHLAAASQEPRDRCRVTALDIDITDRIVRAARGFLEDHTSAIDSIVGAANVRASFESWWAVLREPIELDDDIWLEIRPESIRRGRIEGRGSTVEVLATLEARPRIVLGDRPPPSTRPLPPLGEGVDDGPLQVLVEAVGEYDETSALLTRTLAGTSVELGGRQIELQELRLSGIGAGRVALEALIRGDVDGRLFLVGTPRYDAATGLAYVPDLAFSVSTANLLVSSASWIAEAGLEGLLRERARWPVATAVEWAADRLDEGLNRSLATGVRLQGTVHEVRVLGVRATPDGLVVGAAATADATLVIARGG
ncbi:MAG: DUF4403 family protein [Longimicrobiales bacterium]|nr:DUF4403 family protein [Longimicrobiales bacterium]